MSKLFAFDMDGTVLNTKDQFNQSTYDALMEAKAAGHEVIVATGRPFADIHKVKGSKELFSYYICNNGAYIYDVKNDNFIYGGSVPNEIVHALIEEAGKYQTMFALHTSSAAYRALITNERIDKTLPEWAELQKFDYVTVDEIIEKMQIEKVMQASIRSTADVVKKIQEDFKIYSDVVDAHIANDVYLDINPIGTSKFAGLLKLAKITGHKPEDMIAFGDSGNDVQMLEGAGLGIAMGNAFQAAIDVADEVIGDNDSDAIAGKVRELI